VLTAPVHSYKDIFMYIDDKSIPVRRVRQDSSTGKYIDAPLSAPFLKGPIPMAWLNEAAKLPGKSINLGLAIKWLAGMSKITAFKLTRKALDQLDISRDAASDALKRLEERGLIRVQRAPGQRPTVEILSVASNVTKSENTE
jgi:DNA-binding transcriptional ArsR family regulator